MPRLRKAWVWKLPQLWHRSQVWCSCHPWPKNFHKCSPQKKEKKKEEEGGLEQEEKERKRKKNKKKSTGMVIP